MQLPQLKPALAGAAAVVPRDAMADPTVVYDESSSGYDNADSHPRLYEERNGDVGAPSADYGGHQQHPSDMHDAPRRQSSLGGEHSVMELRASAAPRSFPSPPVAAPVSCSYSPHVDGTAADRSAFVPLSAAHSDRLNNRMVRGGLSHHATDSSWCCGNNCAARADEPAVRSLPEDDGCGGGCCERFSLRRIGAALLSTTSQIAPGYLLGLIGVVTGMLLFLPWSRNPAHITLMVLSGVVGSLCGLLYWAAERRWYRRWRDNDYNARGATTVYFGVGGVPGWHGQPICGSAAAQYHVHDAADEGSSDEVCCGSVTSCSCCCTTGCARHFIDRQHFRVVLPTVQLLLLGAFVLLSPQVMATWTATTAPTTGLGGGAILADSGAGREARYGATLYPIEAVWKCCLLHAWLGMGFSLPLLWSVLVGIVHMAVLLAQHQHAGPGTLLTLVVWMSVPLLCLIFVVCIAKPRPTLEDEQQQRELLRALAAGRRSANYSMSNRAGVGAPLPLLASLSFSRGRDVFRTTHASMPYSGPSTVTPANPARDAQYSAHPFPPAVLPPPPVAAYSSASYAQTPSARRSGDKDVTRLTLGRYANLVRGGGVRREAAHNCQANDGDPPTAMTRGRKSDARLVARQSFVHPPYDAAARLLAESAQQGAPLSEPAFVAGAEVPPFHNPTGLWTSLDTPLPPQHGQTRDPSASMYSPSTPPHTTREMHCGSAYDPINAVGGVLYSTTVEAAIFPSTEDGAHPSLPPPPVSQQLAPPLRSPIANTPADPTAAVSNLEPTPQPPRPPQQCRRAQQTAGEGAERVRLFSDGTPAATVSTTPSPPVPLPQRQMGSAATKERKAKGGSAATAASGAGDEGRGSGLRASDAFLHDCGYGGEECDGELLMPGGASLQDACAPYLVLDSALVIVDVSPPLCRLLGTTVDAVLFRRLPDVLAWLDVVEHEAVVRLVSAVAQPLRIAALGRGGPKRGTAARRARKESAKAKKGRRKKACDGGSHDGDAEDSVNDDDRYDNDGSCSAQVEAANQWKKQLDSGMLDDVAEEAPVCRVTVRGRCPYYANEGGRTSDINTGGGGRRPPFALCFDVWAERLATPVSKAADAPLPTRKSSVAGGGPPLPVRFVIILRRPLLHGLCDAFPLPLALVHPRTGEVLCWNRYAARLTGCAAYDMLGTSAYSNFLYEAPPGAAMTASSRGAYLSTRRRLPPPPPLPHADSMPSAHQQQRTPNPPVVSAATAIGTVPGGEVASHAHSALPAKSTAATTAALRYSSQQTTPPALSSLHGARVQRQHGGAGNPPFAEQESLPPNVTDLNGTFTYAASRQQCAAPLPGLFYVPCPRTAAAVANMGLNSLDLGGGLATASASGGRGARQSSTSTIGGSSYRASPPQLPWALAGRGGGKSGSGNNNSNVSGASAGARCLRPPPPPPPLEGHPHATSTYDEAAAAFDADGNEKVQGNDGEGDDGAMLPSCRYTVAEVRGQLFRATLRPLRGVLCSEEDGVVENRLGRPLPTNANAVTGEHADGSAAVEEQDAGERRTLVLENVNVGVEHNSGSDDGGEAVLSVRHLERQQEQRRHRLGRSAASARMRNGAHEEDSGAEDESDVDDDDDIPFDEDDLPKEMNATVNGGLTLAATLEQLFAAKSMLCYFGLDRESAAGPRRSAASSATTTAASEALLISELLPQYSLCKALQQLAASEAPLLLTLSEPPVYATDCASAESLLQERRLSHHCVSSVLTGELGYSGVLTRANNGGAVAAISGNDYANVPECRLGKSPPPQSSLLLRQRPQVPALWGDGSASLQFVAAVREAVESYRESIEEDSSGYTDLLGLLSLHGGSDCMAHNSSSSVAFAPFSCAPDAAVKAVITPDAVRQLRLLKCLSDQLLQATAAYNRTRQSMRLTTRRLSGGGVAEHMSPSLSSPSFSHTLFGAPAAPEGAAAHDSHLNAHHPRSATTPLLCKDPPTSGSLEVCAYLSPYQRPPPPPNPSSTREATRGVHQHQQGSNPHRRKPGDPPVSASTGGSGEQTRIYRDPNGMSPPVASENVAAAAGATGGNGNSTFNEPPPPPNRGAAHLSSVRGGVTDSVAATGGTGERIGAQNTGASPVKARPRHAAKSAKTTARPNASGAGPAGARHSSHGGTPASAAALSTPLAPSNSAVESVKPRSSGHTGASSGSAPFAGSPGGGEGAGRTTAATPAATAPLNASSSAVAAGPLPAMVTPRQPAADAGDSALDMATPQTELNSPSPRHDPILAAGGEASGRGDAAGEDASGAVGVASRSATSPRFQGSRLLSPSLAAAEMVEVEAGDPTDPRQLRRRSSAAHKREGSLDVLPGALAGSGSFCVHSELIPTSNSVSPPAGAGVGAHGTSSSSPHPARPGSSSLNANATAVAAATAAVRSTPRRLGEGTVWAVLVSRDEATIPSCCISSNLGEEFRLGRSSKCTAVVSDSFVSSTQFSIVRSVSVSTTQDLQSPNSGRGERGVRRSKAFTVTLYDRSANGTYVNVKKLGKDKSCVLRDKALITFRLSTSQFFLGFVFMLTDELGVPLDDRTGIGYGSGLRSLLDAPLSPRPLTGRRNNASIAGGGGKESVSSQNTVVASPTSISASAARRNTPRALSTPDNSSFASATPNGSRRAGAGAQRSGRHAHRETIEWKIGEEMLGKGGNAEVYLGINLTNGQLIAVKRVRLPTCAHGSDAEPDPEAKAILQQYRSLQEEINVLSKATHPNIVQYYGSSQNSTYFNILLEFVPGGSLRHLLDNFGALSPGVILSYLHQALEGLAYLHRHNIVHSDFKAANILITEKGKVKLTDFGTARLLNRPHATAAAAAAARGGGDAHSGTLRATSGQRSDDAVSLGAGGTLHVTGTLRWMDPALFRNTHSIGATDGTTAGGATDPSGRLGGPTKAGDIWSVGCTMIEMMSGEAPWFEYDFESEEQIVNLLSYTAEPPEIPECPECPDLVTVAQTCLKMDPLQRPTCEVLLRIVEEAMARLQAQSMSPSVSPSREVSQQQSVSPGSVSGAGAAVRSSSATVDHPMEPGAGTASVSPTVDPAAAHISPLDDRRRAERVGRPSDSTPASFVVGGDEAGSSAPASAYGAAASTAC